MSRLSHFPLSSLLSLFALPPFSLHAKEKQKLFKLHLLTQGNRSVDKYINTYTRIKTHINNRSAQICDDYKFISRKHYYLALFKWEKDTTHWHLGYLRTTWKVASYAEKLQSTKLDVYEVIEIPVCGYWYLLIPVNEVHIKELEKYWIHIEIDFSSNGGLRKFYTIADILKTTILLPNQLKPVVREKKKWKERSIEICCQPLSYLRFSKIITLRGLGVKQ